MNTDLATKLSLIYVEKNLKPGDDIAQAVALYNEANKKIKEINSDTFNKHVADPNFSL